VSKHAPREQCYRCISFGVGKRCIPPPERISPAFPNREGRRGKGGGVRGMGDPQSRERARHLKGRERARTYARAPHTKDAAPPRSHRIDREIATPKTCTMISSCLVTVSIAGWAVKRVSTLHIGSTLVHASAFKQQVSAPGGRCKTCTCRRKHRVTEGNDGLPRSLESGGNGPIIPHIGVDELFAHSQGQRGEWWGTGEWPKKSAKAQKRTQYCPARKEPTTNIWHNLTRENTRS
jgi:hypothetical protein